MLTPPQITHYGRRWGAVCSSNHWKMARGRLAGEADPSRSRSEWHSETWAIAEDYASTRECAMSVDVMRRACTAIVAGRHCSTKDLTNAQFDRLLTLFDLLIDPDNLTAVMKWNDESEGLRRRCFWLIRKSAPEAYIRTVCADKFGTSHWEDLPVDSLKQLAMTLTNRNARRHEPVKEIPQATENQPF